MVWAVQKTVGSLQLQFIDGGRRFDHAATSSNSFQVVGGASDQFIDKLWIASEWDLGAFCGIFRGR